MLSCLHSNDQQGTQYLHLKVLCFRLPSTMGTSDQSNGHKRNQANKACTHWYSSILLPGNLNGSFHRLMERVNLPYRFGQARIKLVQNCPYDNKILRDKSISLLFLYHHHFVRNCSNSQEGIKPYLLNRGGIRIRFYMGIRIDTWFHVDNSSALGNNYNHWDYQPRPHL